MLTPRIRPILISFFIGLTIIYSYFVPITKIQSPDILSGLRIPESTQYWQSRDASGEINIQDERYKFLNRVIARQYMNDLGEGLLLLVVDSVNFHHPRNCFLASGFNVRTLENVSMEAARRRFKAQALYMSKEGQATLVVYWMCVDKKIVGWTGQKFRQLFYALFLKEKIGLMTRLDIPVRGERIADAVKLAQDFVKAIGNGVPQEQQDYLFGRAE